MALVVRGPVPPGRPPADVRARRGRSAGRRAPFPRDVPRFCNGGGRGVPRRGGAPARSSPTPTPPPPRTSPARRLRRGVAGAPPRRPAVVVPVAEDAPTPFLAAALAKLGAHAVLRRPADDPGFVLRLTERRLGRRRLRAHAAREDHRRRGGRFSRSRGNSRGSRAGGSAFASDPPPRMDAGLRVADRRVSRPSIERHDTGRVASFRTPQSDGQAPFPGNRRQRRPPPAPPLAALLRAAAAFAVDGASLASSSFLFARNDANARVAAFRAVSPPTEARAGASSRRASAAARRPLLLETRPSGGRRRRAASPEPAEPTRASARRRLCTGSGCARAAPADAARAARTRTARSSAERSRSRGARCVRLDRGRAAPAGKRRMGAMPARRRRWYSSTLDPRRARGRRRRSRPERGLTAMGVRQLGVGARDGRPARRRRRRPPLRDAAIPASPGPSGARRVGGACRRRR